MLFGTTLLAAALMLAALAGGVAAAAAPAGSAPTVAQLNATDNATATDDATAGGANATAPGAQLAGVIGVQQTEVAGEVDNRSFGLRVANADSDDERAAIIAARQAETRDQVATQAQQLADLRAARDAGNLTDSEYRARVAIVAAQAANTERAAGQLNRTASDLPEPVRERNGINVTAIDRLRTEARTLGGPETAEIARGIGGTAARNPLSDSPRGPPAATPGAGTPGQQRGGQAAGQSGSGRQANTPAGDTPGSGAADAGANGSDRRTAGNDAASNGAAGTSGSGPNDAGSNDADNGGANNRDGRSAGNNGNSGGPNSETPGSGGSDNAGGPNRP